MNGASGVAIDPYGNIFVASASANQVVEYGAGGTAQMSFTTGLFAPSGIAVDGLDDLYVVNNNASLSVFQRSGALAHRYRNGQPPGSMTAVGIDGPLLITSQANAAFAFGTAPIVQTWDADSLVTGNVQQHPNSALSSISYIDGLAVDSQGGIWASDRGLEAIMFATSAGSGFTVFRMLNYIPGSIAVDSARGVVYVSDVNNNSIHVYTTKGQHIATFS